MPLPTVRQFKVLQKREEAEGTFTLVLEPADGQPLFTFLAGQFVMLHLTNPDGSFWAMAAYSISTAPCESGETIELGIKLHGDFTKRAYALEAGDVVGIQGPYGVFTLKTNVPQLVIFAAGVGVTPFRSMIREALLMGKTFPIYLFYSERTLTALAYERELRELAEQYSNLHPIFILTRDRPDGWDGETVRLNAEMVKRYIPNMQQSHYCMCGPDEFMKSIKEMLVAEGVDVKTSLQQESFG